MTRPVTLVVVGAGPGGTGLLERLAASAPELVGDAPVDVHLVDPYPPGPGKVWRADQSPLLRMNSMAEDVTMFTDETVTCEGPVRPGPSLLEWAEAVRSGKLGADGPTDWLSDEVRAEVAALDGMTFPTRRLQSAYLAWVFARVAAGLPANVTLRTHADRVTHVTDAGRPGPAGRQHVWLAGRRRPLEADAVVLALGHLDVEPGAADAALAGFARAQGLFHLPPAYTGDVDLSGIPPRADVAVRGFGLAFVDLMVLLTEGRGGRFVTRDDGRLAYERSGEEPTLYVGSRRGVPYRTKIGYRLQGPRPPQPRFFDAAAVDRLLDAHPRLDFWDHVWPLAAKEVAWGHYHELFVAHPERTALSWAEFSERFAALDWGDPRLAALVDAAVRSPEDRLDILALDRPLRGVREGFGDLQRRVRAHVAADLARRLDPAHSADLGAFNALLAGFAQVARLSVLPQMGARARTEDLMGWWFGFFNYFASGPPALRTEQLLALADAGVVRFLGADMWVEADPDGGRFRAGSASTDHVVEATALVEARLPKPDLARTRGGPLRRLHAAGEGTEDVVVDDADGFRRATGRLRVGPDLRVLAADGRAHPRRFALGAPTNRPAAGTFSRPRTNAAAFRQSDALARTVLATLAEASAAASRTEPAVDTDAGAEDRRAAS